MTIFVKSLAAVEALVLIQIAVHAIGGRGL